MNSKAYRPAIKARYRRNGELIPTGTRVHALKTVPNIIFGFKALCGARVTNCWVYGGNSAWAYSGLDPTTPIDCKRCKDRIPKAEEEFEEYDRMMSELVKVIERNMVGRRQTYITVPEISKEQNGDSDDEE